MVFNATNNISYMQTYERSTKH